MAKATIHTVYRTADGNRVPSVTTINGILGKPQLIHWAWKCGVDGLDYQIVRDEAAHIGTLAHAMILASFTKTPVETENFTQAEMDLAKACFIKYANWASQHVLEPILLETPLVSENHRYGGTMDFYGKVDGVLTLLDFKTSKALYAEYLIQLAAYVQLLVEHNYPVEQVRLLRMGKDDAEGFEDRVLGNLDPAWQIFKNCREIYESQKQLKI